MLATKGLKRRWNIVRLSAVGCSGVGCSNMSIELL
jgi:hypothetical protein